MTSIHRDAAIRELEAQRMLRDLPARFVAGESIESLADEYGILVRTAENVIRQAMKQSGRGSA